MSNLLDIARRALASRSLSAGTETGEKGDKGEKSITDGSFSPLSPFSHPTSQNEGSSDVVLTGLEPWKLDEAIRLMARAEELLLSTGISGKHPNVQAAAAMIASAYATCDLETVRFAAVEFELVIRQIVLQTQRQERHGSSAPCSNSV